MSADPDRAHQTSPIPRSIRHLPPDLAAVAALVVLTGLSVLFPGINETPLRIIVGLPFVLFVPGYAFIAALFPEDVTDETDTSTDASSSSDDAQRAGDEASVDQRLSLQHVRDRGSIDGIERVALSFGTSIAIVPLLGLVLNFTPWGIRLMPVYLTVAGFTLLATVVAAHRRYALPPDARFRVPFGQWLGMAHTELLEPESRTDLMLNVLLVVSVLLAGASVTYAVAVPNQGESFTEFYVLTENETGELVADDYPTEFTVGESKPIHVGISNHEHRDLNYTVVILLQRVEMANNTTQVLAERELQRLDSAVLANGTWQEQITLTPPMEGQRQRLAFLLYRNAPPAQPTVTNAYRELHLWVNVTASGDGQARRSPRVGAAHAPQY